MTVHGIHKQGHTIKQTAEQQERAVYKMQWTEKGRLFQEAKAHG